MSFLPNGAAYIRQQIDRALTSGQHHVTITGDYEIEETILLPSDFTLTLEDCHLRMADNTFCNMFTNANCRTEAGRTEAGTDSNITLRGVGRAILDGGNYNGLHEKNAGLDGRPPIYVNNLLLFANVDGFRIENLHVRNQRWWALNFLYCAHGYIGNVDFLSDYSFIGPDGIRRFGLGKRQPDTDYISSYQDTYIKNSDGIDLRCGCHDIIIENITGFAEDDIIALTGLPGDIEENFEVYGREQDICNIVIRNIVGCSYCGIIRLLNQSGVKLYNVLIDGVFDSSKNSPCLERTGHCVRIGDNHMYGTRHATAEETCNITVRNLYSRAETSLMIAGAMSDCSFENIRTFDGGGDIRDTATVDTSAFFK